jgi:PadR family transcriptional regulator, regulatory protein PadR
MNMEKDHKEESVDIASARTQMRKGVLEFCILLTIGKDKVYASEILAELKKSELLVVEGTLYPLLSRLRSEELLSYTWEESKSGPPRKYYTLTDKGRKTLIELKKIWNEMAQSIDSLIKK